MIFGLANITSQDEAVITTGNETKRVSDSLFASLRFDWLEK